MALRVRLKETRRILCFEDGHTTLKAVTEVPPTEELEAFSLDGFLSLELSSKAIGGVLRGLFSDDLKERYFVGVISYLAHKHAKDAVASEVDTVALKVDFEVMTDIFEASERCMVCLVEFQLSEAVERKPCGHTYHENCTEYYIKRNIDCPTCFCEPESSSSRSSNGEKEFVSEEDIIKVSCDFPNTDDDDDESEEESSDEPDEMCMVCLVEFGPKEVVKRKPCGHTYHEDCMEYYTKHDMDCPACYYDGSESSSGNTDDHESEEENSDEPGEMCLVCLVEFQPREAVERKPCGHTYHADCMEYYIKHDIDCPTCSYDEPESSSKSWIGARESADEEDIIKTFCDSLNVDETEEESSDESGEMCSVSRGFCNIDDDDKEEGSSGEFLFDAREF